MKASEIFTRYPNQYTKEDVAAARKWLEEVKEERSNGVFASFANGKLAVERLNGPCHGSISSVALFGPLIANLTKGPTNLGYSNKSLVRTDKALAERWFNWLLHDTYWSPFYVDTTVKEAMYSGLLVPSTLPANLMQGCNILTRHNHEHQNSVQAWDMLVKAGMEPDIAYLCTFCWGLTLQAFKENYSVALSPLGHNAVGALLPSVVSNFLDRNYNNLLNPLFGNKNIYKSYGLSSQIPYNEKQTQPAWYGGYQGGPPPPKHIVITAKFLNSLGKKGEVSEVVSPFAKREATPQLIAQGIPRPGAKIILDNAKTIQEWLLKEYVKND